MPPPPRLPSRFPGALDALGLRGTGARVLVAVSGGRDSAALLHLLRFAADDPALAVEAAHFDHAMRPDSGRDAAWVRGLCRGWGVALHEGRAAAPLRGEAAAREARYAFLRRVRELTGATHLATAHHADDQAETVLFRVLRGTGIDGLAGIPAADGDGTVRPLLGFTRDEVGRYARRAGLRWREDPTNALADAARNRIRLELLPRIERTVAPGARRALARLASLAAEERAAWEAVLRPLAAEAAREEDGALLLVRERFTAYDAPLAARLLRALLGRVGARPDRTGTRLALEFITGAPSGREFRLAGGVRIVTEFGVARVERAPEAAGAPPPDRPLPLPGPADGEGRLRVGGRWWTARWSLAAPLPGPGTVRIALGRVRFPLLLRGARPGDRLRCAAGRRPLKKLFGEARIPVRERRTLPVLADAAGAVLWVPGIAVAHGSAPLPGEPAITLSLADAEH
jgi:tRNA(Ile)-lysidine synthase